ncbi:MAG: SDR family NAD(P)-dependent oxidoreductase [Thermoleophilaceae bacterium]|nr:SDR family NAD(P)-dependent oxidoreductase [Thermoleophilaceae bacterium]
MRGVETALVTGAGRGLGFAIADRLAARGLAVLLTDLDAESADRAARSLHRPGRQALTCAIRRRAARWPERPPCEGGCRCGSTTPACSSRARCGDRPTPRSSSPWR